MGTSGSYRSAVMAKNESDLHAHDGERCPSVSISARRAMTARRSPGTAGPGSPPPSAEGGLVTLASRDRKSNGKRSRGRLGFNSPLQFDVSPLGVARYFPLRLARGLLLRLDL